MTAIENPDRHLRTVEILIVTNSINHSSDNDPLLPSSSMFLLAT